MKYSLPGQKGLEESQWIHTCTMVYLLEEEYFNMLRIMKKKSHRRLYLETQI